MANKTNLELYRGDDRTWSLAFADSVGDPIDLTDATIWFTLKQDVNDPDPGVLQKTVTEHDNAVAGLSSLILTSADTIDLECRPYQFDMQLVDSNEKVTTFLRGVFSILDDVTISVAVEEPEPLP